MIIILQEPDLLAKGFFSPPGCTSGTVTDPAGPSSGSGRVNRGGSWRGTARICRSTYRISVLPSSRDDNLGFRLLRVAQ